MKRRFLVNYDYGMGGAWAFVLAEAEEEIVRRFPELTVVTDPPEASNFINPADGPFTVGLGKVTELPERPMPALVESSRLETGDGGYRLLVLVAPDGEFTFGPLEGPAPLRGGGC
jgi:hypothetical protein